MELSSPLTAVGWRSERGGRFGTRPANGTCTSSRDVRPVGLVMAGRSGCSQPLPSKRGANLFTPWHSGSGAAASTLRHRRCWHTRKASMRPTVGYVVMRALGVTDPRIVM